MTSQQLQTLLSPPSNEASTSRAVLFLNGKFRNVEDLTSVIQDGKDIPEIERRRDELKDQLTSSQESVTALLTQARQSAQSKLSEAKELALERYQLQDELAVLSCDLQEGEGGEQKTLYRELDTLHRNLKELESVKAYVGIAKHALEQSESSIAQIHSAFPPGSSNPLSLESLATYQTLQQFVDKVEDSARSSLQVEGNLNLVEFLRNLQWKTWNDIKSHFITSLLVAAEKLRWPMSVDYPAATADERRVFEKAFRDLLQLQNLGTLLKIDTKSTSLYPLQALVQPVSLRFKYHFEGKRQTNRLDKPEWYFTHILNVIQEQKLFLDKVIQPLLTSFDSKYKQTSVWREFARLLLPLLNRKLLKTVPSLPPALLAHTIYQALAFDVALAEEGIGPQDGDEWKGVSDVILGRREWLNNWIEGEKRFAEDQYHEIISASDAWQIETEDEDGGPGSMRTTHSARRFKALIEQVTDRYTPLPSLDHRTRFLTSIQLPLLQSYHDRISASLDAFETLSSALVRAVPGALGVSLRDGGSGSASVNVETRRLTSGVEGVQRLCKAYVSARAVELAMGSWGEEVFFLELWSFIKEKDHREGSTVFDAPVSEYRTLTKRAEDIIVLQVCGEIEGELKAHLNANPSESKDEIGVSQTLLPSLALLSTHLAYLRATMSSSDSLTLTTLYRRIASRLAEHILQRQILYRGGVSLTEGKIIEKEGQLWVETCYQALGMSRQRAEAPWERLISAGRIIASEGDEWDTIVRLIGSVTSDDDWEQEMGEVLGSFGGVSREEVGRLVRRRQP